MAFGIVGASEKKTAIREPYTFKNGESQNYLTYSEIVYLRQVLTKLEGHSWDGFAGLAGNVLSPNNLADIAFIIAPVRKCCTWRTSRGFNGQYEGDNAGRAALALLTRAAYGDIASDVGRGSWDFSPVTGLQRPSRPRAFGKGICGWRCLAVLVRELADSPNCDRGDESLSHVVTLRR